LVRASRTSSSLNGLMMAVTNFMKNDNSNRQNALHNPNLTRFPARGQLHKKGAAQSTPAEDLGLRNPCR
jgi:hypothetical protein